MRLYREGPIGEVREELNSGRAKAQPNGEHLHVCRSPRTSFFVALMRWLISLLLGTLLTAIVVFVFIALGLAIVTWIKCTLTWGICR